MKKRFLSMLVLLVAVVSGAWAQDPATYKITVAEGTEDADKWTISPNPAPAGSPVTATYNGSKKVKSVKAVKKGSAVDNTYLKWDADQKKLVATEIPTTAITVENADAEVNWQAGTYVVEGEDVKINGAIILKGEVNLIIKDGATLTADKIIGGNKNLSIYGQANQSGQLVVNCTNDAIYNITILEVHSAKVTATASTPGCGGFYSIGTINVYGGLVDAKCTAEEVGYGICLQAGGKMNIHGGEVKAEGKGADDSYSSGILCDNSDNKATVTVYGGKLWSGNADRRAINAVNLKKGDGFTGKIETSADNSAWTEYTEAGTPETHYVRVGY